MAGLPLARLQRRSVLPASKSSRQTAVGRGCEGAEGCWGAARCVTREGVAAGAVRCCREHDGGLTLNLQTNMRRAGVTASRLMPYHRKRSGRHAEEQ